MMVRYGKRGKDLICLKETGYDQDDKELSRHYEFLWVIDERRTDHLIMMLIEAGCLGIDPWRLMQIKIFYEISDDELIKFALGMYIDIDKKNGEYCFTRRERDTGIIRKVRGNDIFFGIVQTLLSSGYRVQPDNTRPIV